MYCLFYLKVCQIPYVLKLFLKVSDMPIGNFMWEFNLLEATNKQSLELNQ